MNNNVLKSKWAWLAVLIMALFLPLTACSDDKDDLADDVVPVDSYGTWWNTYSPSSTRDIVIIVIGENGHFTYYETGKDYYAKGEYTYREEGTYTYTQGKFIFTLEGKVFTGEYSGGRLVVGYKDYYSLNADQLPTKPATGATTNDPTGDALSNTEWKATAIQGDEVTASEKEDFVGMVLRFGSNGKVTEIYPTSEVINGTYSISGDLITFKDLYITRHFLTPYNFTVSGSTLTLIIRKGKYNQTDIIMKKQ